MSAQRVDFQELKTRIGIEDTAQYLGLHLVQNGEGLRGPCPACNRGGDRALVITPGRESYYCFAEKKGGDCIALVAHITGKSFRESAEALHTHFLGSQKPAQAPQNGDPLQNVRSYLQTTHEAVQAIGIPPEVGDALGIGHAPKGMMRGRIAFPIRTETGQLVGYLGIAPGADVRVPTNLREKL